MYPQPVVTREQPVQLITTAETKMQLRKAYPCPIAGILDLLCSVHIILGKLPANWNHWRWITLVSFCPCSKALRKAAILRWQSQRGGCEKRQSKSAGLRLHGDFLTEKEQSKQAKGNTLAEVG